MNPQQLNNFSPMQTASSDDQKTKKMFVGMGTLLFVSIILVFFTIVNRGSSNGSFIQAIGIHREELRLAELVDDLSEDDQNLANYQANLKALVTSDLTSLQTAYGKDVNDKQVASLADQEAESRFTEASQTNSLTKEYKKTLSSTINTAVIELKKLREEAKSEYTNSIDTAIANQKSLLTQLDKL